MPRVAVKDGAIRSGALVLLRAQADQLPKALARLARYVLEHPDAVLYQSITELADIAQVGEATVIRFCRHLGFKGFQDFKLALAADLALSSAPNGPPGSLAELLERCADEAARALRDTCWLLDHVALERVVALLVNASQLLIFGAGASGITAQDFGYKFLRLGYRVSVHQDPHLAAMEVVTLDSQAVVIGITRSGSTIDTVRVLELARERGLPRVVCCQHPKSPAAALADHLLLSATAESPLTGGSIPSKMGQLLVLDVLFAALLKRKPGAAEAVAATARAVSDRNY